MRDGAHVLVTSMRATVALRSLGRGRGRGSAPVPVPATTSVLILGHVGELAEEWLWGGRVAVS